MFLKRYIILLLLCSSVIAQSGDGYMLEIPQEFLDMDRFKYGLKMTGSEISCDDDGKTIIQTYQLVYQTKAKSRKDFQYSDENTFSAGDGDGKVEVYLLQIGFPFPLDLSTQRATMGTRAPLMIAPSNRQEVRQPIINLFRDVFREKKKELMELDDNYKLEDISLIGYTSNEYREAAGNALPKFMIWNHSQVTKITTDADLNYFYLDVSDFTNVDGLAEGVSADIEQIIEEKNNFYVFMSNGLNSIISESKKEYQDKIVNTLYSLRTPYPSIEHDFGILKLKIGDDLILQKKTGAVNVHFYVSKKFCSNSLMNLMKQLFRKYMNADETNQRIPQSVNLILHIEQEGEDGLYNFHKCEYSVPAIIEELESNLNCDCRNE